MRRLQQDTVDKMASKTRSNKLKQNTEKHAKMLRVRSPIVYRPQERTTFGIVATPYRLMYSTVNFGPNHHVHLTLQ